MSLDTRPGAVYQAKDKTDNAALPRIRFQFSEDPDFTSYRLLKYYSGDFQVAGKTIKMLFGKEYMASYRICNMCRRWNYTEKEVYDQRIPRGHVCKCGEEDKEEKRMAAEKRDNNKAARRRKLSQMSDEAADAANPFMQTEE